MQINALRKDRAHLPAMTAPRRIAIIQGHPDPTGKRLCHALAAAYAKGASLAEHEVRHIELSELSIPYLRSQKEFQTGGVVPDIALAQATIEWADHWVIIFPLWLGTMPALLKSFFEQVGRPGFAFSYEKGGPRPHLKGRSAHVVVTMGMPAFIFRWFYLAHGLRCLSRNILAFIGIAPVRETLFGSVETVSDATRQAWLAKMEKLGLKGL